MRPALLRPRRPRVPGARLAAVLTVLSVLLLSAGLGAAPAAAATVRDVRLTQDGPVPARLTIVAGDTLRFVNTDTFVHRVVSDSANWAFDSRTLVPGQTFTVTPALTAAGTYAYRGAGLDTFTGSVVVPAGASPRPSPARTSAPAAVPSREATPAPAASPTTTGSPAPSPVATGGSGVVQGPPPLAGGSFGGLVGPTPSPGGPAPLVADPLPDVPLPAPAPAAEVSPDPGPGTTTAAFGDLPRLVSPVEARRYGLPLVLAAVLLTGVVSLLARLLLHEAPAPDDGPTTA